MDIQNIATFTAGEALVDYEGYALTDGGTGTLAKCTATTDIVAGVLYAGAASGEKVSVAMPGSRVNVLLAATTRRGQYLKVTAQAKGTPAAFASGDVVFAQAMEAGVAGDLVECLIVPTNKIP